MGIYRFGLGLQSLSFIHCKKKRNFIVIINIVQFYFWTSIKRSSQEFQLKCAQCVRPLFRHTFFFDVLFVSENTDLLAVSKITNNEWLLAMLVSSILLFVCMCVCWRCHKILKPQLCSAAHSLYFWIWACFCFWVLTECIMYLFILWLNFICYFEANG